MRQSLLSASAFFAICALLASSAIGATRIMPLGDSITEGLCSDGSNANTSSSTCYVPYYEPANAAIYNHYDTEPTFCGEFARHMVEDYNHGAAGGYRGPLLTQLRAAGIDAAYVGDLRSGSALAGPIARTKATAIGSPNNSTIARAAMPHTAAFRRMPDTLPRNRPMSSCC